MTDPARKRRPKRRRTKFTLSSRTLAVIDETRVAIRVNDDGTLAPPADASDPQYGYLTIPANGGTGTIAESLEKLARSVGRIDINGVGAGTGVLVGDRQVLTAGHVVGILERGSNNLFADGLSTIDFSPRPGGDAAQRFTITGAVVDGPYANFQAGADGPDLMLLVLDRAPTLDVIRPNLEFTINTIANPAVAVIGYPSFSQDSDPNVMRAIVSTFGDAGNDCYTRKCITVHSLSPRPSQNNFSQLYYDHRAPTMPQCSGGPAVELNTMSLVAIHTAGSHLVVNIAQSLTATVNKLPDDPVAKAISVL